MNASPTRFANRRIRLRRTAAKERCFGYSTIKLTAIQKTGIRGAVNYYPTTAENACVRAGGMFLYLFASGAWIAVSRLLER